MAKAASAEIGQKRYYHWLPDGASCACEAGKWNPACQFSLLSVTTVLKALPKEWLGAWAAKMVAETAIGELANLAAMQAREGTEAVVKYLKGAPWRKRDAAAQRGTDTHTAAETGATGDDVPEHARGRVRGWHMWLDDYQPVLTHQEFTVYSPSIGVAGTADMRAWINREAWLIDIKTGDVHWDQRLQQAAYRYGDFIVEDAAEAPVPEVDRVGILTLRDDGYSFYEIKVGEDEWCLFRRLASTYRDIERLSAEKPSLIGKADAA